MTDILPLWACALALLLVVLGTLLFVLLREGGTAANKQADEDRMRSLFLTRRQELRQALHGDALSQAQRELDQQLIECLGEPDASPRPARWFSAGWTRIGVAAVLSFGLPLAALALYLQVGDPRAAIAAVQPTVPPHPVEGADVNGMVERLTQRLKQQPADLEGWMVLARSLEVMERYGDASEAYRRAIVLASAPDQAWLRAKLNADLADALGSAQAGALTGPALEAIDAALALDPNQPKALALAGTAAAARGDLAQARHHWGRLLTVLEPGSDLAARVSADLAALGTPSAAAPAAASDVRPAASSVTRF
ncbi:cytochrome c-type biogenesis protein CcmH [Roseateles sp. YR242]|uniref:c-type cytochrome biogenesis protein CcmI n=1 Tax=Roseateles sp. YR242 TaxID=1855305 RepID=UPI0008CC4768|nr:c-type cytochrome biogenesis protein CcmI [Roseateles sp. YR242]SEK97568.1 cytochrome c-type biogenesis protein CcmH [Roseateles sp. YR242]